jgi:hypothetical protein
MVIGQRIARVVREKSVLIVKPSPLSAPVSMVTSVC